MKPGYALLRRMSLDSIRAPRPSRSGYTENQVSGHATDGKGALPAPPVLDRSHLVQLTVLTKGKIERFFRTTRDQFLIRQLDLSSLAALNKQFNDWVENEYNASVHSAIEMKPIDRFGMDLKRIRYFPPSETSDELFFAEKTRTVKKDNTFSFRGNRYETPVDLADRKIQIRYERHRASTIVVYYKGQRMGPAHLLNTIANGRLRRRKER